MTIDVEDGGPGIPAARARTDLPAVHPAAGRAAPRIGRHRAGPGHRSSDRGSARRQHRGELACRRRGALHRVPARPRPRGSRPAEPGMRKATAWSHERPGPATDPEARGTGYAPHLSQCRPAGRPPEEPQMAYVIAAACVDHSDQSCVSVCPVDCIWGDLEVDRKMYVDPESCIECGACRPVCPNDAIVPAARSAAGVAGLRLGGRGVVRRSRRGASRRRRARAPSPDMRHRTDPRTAARTVGAARRSRRARRPAATDGAKRDGGREGSGRLLDRPPPRATGRRRSGVQGRPVLRPWPRRARRLRPAAVLDLVRAGRAATPSTSSSASSPTVR